MKTPNEKEADKRISSLLSVVNRQIVDPSRQFLDGLKAGSTAEFLADRQNITETTEKRKITVSIWRTIMQSRITKLATAAAVVVAVGLVIHFSGGSVDLTTIAIGEITEAMKKQPWMHYIGRGVQGKTAQSLEVWINYEQKVAGFKYSDRIEFWDVKTGKYEFNPERNIITAEQFDDNEGFPAHLSSPAAAIETMYEGFRSMGAEMTTREGQYEGQAVHIQEIALASEKGRPKQAFRLYIEPKSKLILASELEVTDPNGQVMVNMTGTYSYPANGPDSIYDLGVPRDVKIIDMPAGQDFRKIWDRYRPTRFNATRRHISITTHTDHSLGGVITTVGVEYKSDKNQRMETYNVFKPGEQYDEFWPRHKKQLGDSFDSLLAWTAKRYKEADGRQSAYLYNFYDELYSGSAATQLRGKWINYDKPHLPADAGPATESLIQLGWPEFGPFGQLTGRIIEDDYSRESNLVCIERLLQGSANAETVSLPARILFYVDGAKDHICVRHVTEWRPDAEWQRDKNWLDGVDPDKITDGSITVHDTTEVIQAPNGHWYPKLIEIKQSGIREDYRQAELKVTAVKKIYIRTDPEFPKDIFNADKFPSQ